MTAVFAVLVSVLQAAPVQAQETEDTPFVYRSPNERRYVFTDAETLIDDFFDEVERTLSERRVGGQVTQQ